MANSVRDINVSLSGNKEEYVPLGEITFLYLKDSPVELKVLIDGATILMSPGDEQRFAEPVTQMTVINSSTSVFVAKFIVGQGSFRRTRLFTGIEGAIGVMPTLLDSNGTIFQNTLRETGYRIGIANEREATELGSDRIYQNATFGQGNISGGGLPYFIEQHTWDQYRRFDRRFNYYDADNRPCTLASGSTAVFASFRGSFIHPFDGYHWFMTADAASGDAILHKITHGRDEITDGAYLTAASGESFQQGAPAIDRYTGNLIVPYSSTQAREFKWIAVPTLAGIRWTLEALQDLTFSFGNISQVNRLGDGKYLVQNLANVPRIYDTLENDLDDLGTYQQYEFVTGNETGFGTTAASVIIDERSNRGWVPGASAEMGPLFDRRADVFLTLHDEHNGSRNFEHWKNPMGIAGVRVIRDGGYRFLTGSVAAAVVGLVRGSPSVPESYLDYIYKIRFHNGISWTVLDGGRKSLKAQDIPDGLKMNLAEPIYLSTRAGLLDIPNGLPINDYF